MMSTSLSSALIPQIYREVFDACSNDGKPIHMEVYNYLLSNNGLSNSEVNTIRTLAGATDSEINRTCLYKTLALIAWAQQKRQLSDKLFENCTEKEKKFAVQIMRKLNLPHTKTDILPRVTILINAGQLRPELRR
ncbi:unnamed protein product [Acanthoscelides obtectus]|uniref:Uncharacterized protein n=1 Tax=Acanthoscelides obtectus TaxID=200917 RepID=A0A9P0KLE7_ACAOB|nr:unnamed protein product [Acanthoscelides obtectus]CAK1667616.1 hypothetical protein AOBTE_LOCUS25949 [Acanthoscelides obtectus]